MWVVRSCFLGALFWDFWEWAAGWLGWPLVVGSLGDVQGRSGWCGRAALSFWGLLFQASGVGSGVAWLGRPLVVRSLGVVQGR